MDIDYYRISWLLTDLHNRSKHTVWTEATTSFPIKI